MHLQDKVGRTFENFENHLIFRETLLLTKINNPCPHTTYQYQYNLASELIITINEENEDVTFTFTQSDCNVKQRSWNY